MNWEDERYVRLYTRDTVSWLSWGWETQSVMMHMTRRCDRSGVIDIGTVDPAAALSLLLRIPRDVAARALVELISCGTVVHAGQSLVLPKFVAAQEAKQSDRVRQTESRARRAAKALTQEIHRPVCHTPSHAVTDGHTVSQFVTPAVPSQPCLASLAVPISLVASQTSESKGKPLKALKAPKKPPEPSRPGWQALIDAMTIEFQNVRGESYDWHHGASRGQLKALREKHSDEDILRRWSRGLRGTYDRKVSAVEQLGNAAKWHALATDEERKPSDSAIADHTGFAPRWEGVYTEELPPYDPLNPLGEVPS